MIRETTMMSSWGLWTPSTLTSKKIVNSSYLHYLAQGVSRTVQVWDLPTNEAVPLENPPLMVFTSPPMGWLSTGGSMAS